MDYIVNHVYCRKIRINREIKYQIRKIKLSTVENPGLIYHVINPQLSFNLPHNLDHQYDRIFGWLQIF